MVYKIFDMKHRFVVIEQILSNIHDAETRFDIKLILSEAILNANEHGHQFNDQKAITISVNCTDDYWEFILKDEDPLIKNYTIKDTMHDEDILKESGRGMFLISRLADYVEIIDNQLIIRKDVAYIAK